MSFISESKCFKANVHPRHVALVIKGLKSSQYEEKSLTNYDILNALSTYKSLEAGLDPFITFDTLLDQEYFTTSEFEAETFLNVKGTIPITSDGDIHHIPVIFWLHKDYPESLPIGYVIPPSGTEIDTRSYSVDSFGLIDRRIAETERKKKEKDPTKKFDFTLVDFIRLCIQDFSRTPPIVFKEKGNADPQYKWDENPTHLTIAGLGIGDPGVSSVASVQECVEIVMRELAHEESPVGLEYAMHLYSYDSVQSILPDSLMEFYARFFFGDPPNTEIAKSAMSSPSESIQGKPSHGTDPKFEVFSQELVELLKSQPACRIRLCKFKIAYQSQFGKPFDEVDFGCQKLRDVFSALPRVVQIVGSGPYMSVILLEWHIQQCKGILIGRPDGPDGRFHYIPFVTIYLHQLRVDQQIKQEEYRTWDVEKLCLAVPHIVRLRGSGKWRTIELTKKARKDYSADMEDGPEIITTLRKELERMASEQSEWDQYFNNLSVEQRLQEFAQDCVELVMSVPDHKIPFDRFVPAYTRHFDRKCKLSDYGFEKLINLFEAVPETVKVFWLYAEGKNQRYIGITSARKRGLICLDGGDIDDSSRGGSPVSGSDYTTLTQENLDGTSGRESPVPASGNRTDKFAQECVDLIRNSPDHKISWKNFRVCYHDHFQRWCSSKYYGFEHLVDLFEAVSETVTVFWQGENKYIGLTRKARDSHLASRELNDASGKVSPAPKTGNRTETFAQECVELVMSTSDYKIPWEKFRVSYHDRFERWLNTKYVGFDTIEELFEAVSETVKVFWQGKQKYVGLTRTARDQHLASKEFDGASGQESSALASENDVTRRFAQECVDLVMSTPEHKISFGDFAASYHRYFGKQIKVYEYGYEKLLHLLEAVNHTIKVSWEGENQYVGLTRTALHRYLNPIKELDGASGRESPAPESDDNAKKIFGRECAELIMSMPGNKIALTVFSSSYNRHFGRQIKVSDYGHEKLINLLEAVGETAKLFWQGKERFVGLTYSARQLHLFGQELVELLEAQPKRSIRLENFGTTHTRYFTRQFKPANYGYAKLRDMLEDLPDLVQVKGKNPNAFVTLQVKKMRAPESQNNPLFAQECEELLDKSDHIKHFGDECVELLTLIPDCRYGTTVWW